MSQSNFSVKVKGDRYKRTGTGIENTQSLHWLCSEVQRKAEVHTQSIHISSKAESQQKQKFVLKRIYDLLQIYIWKRAYNLQMKTCIVGLLQFESALS